jgi:hypothetical protein
MKSAHHLILHGLAIKKYASVDDIAGIIGAKPAEVARYLAAQVEKGRIVASHDKYSLKPTTRVAVSGDYSRHYWRLRENVEFVSAYEEFETINISLKKIITAWQVIEVQGSVLANDHSDEVYDSKVIDRLGALHERADRILAVLASQLPRMQIYRDKLKHALERAEDGAIEWVSDARTESYHTLWFELHEDLLCMMGRTRDERDDAHA